jgi:thiamine biosynthesis protein ThiS
MLWASGRSSGAALKTFTPAFGHVSSLTIEYNEHRNGVSNGRMEVAETKTIGVVLNGEPRRVPQGFHVVQLLEFLAIDASKVAVELNRSIVRKQDWSATIVEEGAELEVVWFVGGGL